MDHHTQAGPLFDAGLAPPDRRNPRRSRLMRRRPFVAVLAIIGWSTIGRTDAPAPDAPPPTWNVQLSSAGRGAPWILLYGPRAGVHLVHLSGKHAATPLPMRAADHEVRMISLGFSRMTVHGDAGGAGGLESFGATGRIITIYSNTSGTGVRTPF